ncbi:hypothetical protein [Caminibacter pacificus]|uniref:Uncharacterized protein n=1 Tax=Caminibacter pacificus TaxID=1424653 RepID=A0AAJ4UXH3_9BACT|nr:hypothetical protein [Caminibacter pacificus]QCI28877.1 hypothetical protein C6V80_07820 [Caminibacter pacificus]ROR39468.1 hypothetical protein EDC58_1408 [Caminibacter pacificus]
MELINAIKKSEIVLTQGENKSGKLTFSLFLLSNIDLNSKTLILSTIPKSLMNKRIKTIEDLNDQKINTLLQNTEYLCLKENWEEIKAKYGFDFLIEDIKHIIFDTKPDSIIFHRADLMFSEEEYEYAKWFIDSLIELKEEINFKLLITSKKDTIIQKVIENYCDIDFEIEKKEKRIVNIISSLFPITPLSYIFEKQKELVLIPHEKENVPSSQYNNKTIDNKMLIMSQNEYLIKLNKYLFEKIFNIEIATSITQSISKLLENPEIVIYNPPEKDLNFEMCHIVKDKGINSNIIYILNKDYVRVDDKMQAVYAGCYDVMPKNFNIEEYIFTIEKLTKNFFYTEKINHLPKQREIKNFEHFCKILETFYNERIYFTLFIGETEEVNILQKVRNHDIVFKDGQKTYICFINSNKEVFEKGIKNKIKAKNYTLIEAIEWKEKGICK